MSVPEGYREERCAEHDAPAGRRPAGPPPMNDTNTAFNTQVLNGPLEVRCADGVACVEVVDRLTAADHASAEGLEDAARRLRHRAEQFADAHRYGLDRTELRP